MRFAIWYARANAVVYAGNGAAPVRHPTLLAWRVVVDEDNPPVDADEIVDELPPDWSP